MNEVNELVKKASAAEKSEDAIRFSQAALNVAHAMQVQKQVESKN